MDKEKVERGEGQKEPIKITAAEIILITPALALSDLFDLFDVSGGIGVSFINFSIGFFINSYFFFRGVRSTAVYSIAIVSSLIDSIPGGTYLPAKTIGWVAAVLMINYPKLGKIAEKVAVKKIPGAIKK